MGPQHREQCHRGARAPPAPQAVARPDPHRPRRRLHDGRGRRDSDRCVGIRCAAGCSTLLLASVVRGLGGHHAPDLQPRPPRAGRTARCPPRAFGPPAARTGRRRARGDPHRSIPRMRGPYGQDVVLQVWREGRVLALRSAGAPDARLSHVETGFSDATVAGRHWRVFSGWDVERRNLVQVAEDHALRERLLAHYTLSGLPALLFGVPLLGVLVWLVVGAAVRPLAHSGHEVNRRGPGDLRPLPDVGAPTEVHPLVDRLNALFARISALDAGRAALHLARGARAAHADRGDPRAGRGRARQHRPGRPRRRTRRTSSRVATAPLAWWTRCCCWRGSTSVPRRTGRRQRRLDQAAARVIADLAPSGTRQRRGPRTRHRRSRQRGRGRRPARRAAAQPARQRRPARRRARPGHGALHARHRRRPARGRRPGPGVDEAELAQLGRRFYRAPGARGPGSGLGLSIVQRIADGCGGTVRYRRGDAGRGLVVEVRFRRPPGEPDRHTSIAAAVPRPP